MKTPHSDPVLAKLFAVFSGRMKSLDKAASTPLEQHFQTYRDTQEAKGLSKDRISSATYKLPRLSRECGWKSLADFNGAGLEEWLAAQAKKGMSPGNRNAWRQEFVTFGNWCVRTQRLLENPFALVPRANAKIDPRRKRRALTEAELERLLYVARWRPLAEYGRQSQKRTKGKPRSKHSRRTWSYAEVTYETLDAAIDRARIRLQRSPKFLHQLLQLGLERQLIYKTLALTGLRRGELESLTVRQLRLDDPNPCAMLDAAKEKNRKGSSIPLRSDLVAEIREWLKSKGKTAAAHANSPVFSVPQHLLKAFNKDLALAGIPKRDEHGRTVDVHALRFSFCTMLSQAGVAPRVAQAAMRHSTIDLTMNVYTDERLLNVHGALTLLPTLALNNAKPAAPNSTEKSDVESGKLWPASLAEPEPTPQAADETLGNQPSGETAAIETLKQLSTLPPDQLEVLLKLAKAFGSNEGGVTP